MKEQRIKIRRDENLRYLEHKLIFANRNSFTLFFEAVKSLTKRKPLIPLSKQGLESRGCRSTDGRFFHGS